MRILAATPYYPPEGGGLERYAHEVLRRLVSRGHAVEVLTATRGDDRAETVDGVRVHRRRPWAFASNTPLDPRLAWRVARHARGADVVVAHGPVPGPIELSALGSAAARCPLVVTYHAGALTSTSPALRAVARADRRTLEAFAFRRADRLVAVTEYVRDGPLADHQDRTVVIPPGVDLTRFAPGPGERAPEILFVGPLDPAYAWKGYKVLFDAFLRVADAHPDARLTLVGDGDARRPLAARAREAGLGDRVNLPGRLSDAALGDAYRRAACLVLPSTSAAESFGMVLAEANACATPVVGSRVGGIPCFVRHGENGLLVPPGDVQQLADALSRVLDRPAEARKMGEQGRRLVAREHDWDRLARRTEAVLAAAVTCGPAPRLPEA